jgi:DNA-binding NarL/FixJ family response regulator
MLSMTSKPFLVGSVHHGKLEFEVVRLQWWPQKIRRDLLHNLNIREDELKLLRLAHQGFGSKEIARLFDTRPATIDQRFARLSLRLNVPTRAMAAKLAYESGLLDE